MQESYLRALRSWQDLREAGAMKAWLFTILYREFVRQQTRSRREALEPEALLEPSYDPEPGSAIELAEALATLPEDSRAALVMQVLGGYSCAEIAAQQDSTEGAVMTRLTRARQALRRLLGPDDSYKEAKQ